MAEISAKLVNDLRSKTGQGMMECKKMLIEAGGDVEKAVELFRKKGVKASLAERVASEGRVFGAKSADGKTASLVEINCNTDFTAKSQPIAELAGKGCQALLANPKADVSAVIKEQLTHAAQTTGENVRLGKTACLTNPNGSVGLYIYTISSKIAVLLSVNGTLTDEMVTDLGGHIAFARPMSMDRSGIPADLVAKEKEIAVEQAKATGKPQNIAEKIAEGKLDAFFKEKALLDQEFFIPSKFQGSVAQYLKSKGATLVEFVRMEVGHA